MRALASPIISIILLISPVGGIDLNTKASDFGLRGSVHQSIERITYPASGPIGERTITTTSLFSAKGWLLEKRAGTTTGTDYVTTYTYDATGQLISVNSNSGTLQVTYDHDPGGRKRVTEHFPTRTAERKVAVGAIPWEDSDLQFPSPVGGTITTIYNEQNRPIEGQVRDASGNLTMRIVRSYDEQGNVTGDKLIPEEINTPIPNELASQLGDAQKKAMASFVASAFYSGESKYKYDAKCRVVEKHRSRGVVGDTSTTIKYNDRGDISEEITLERRQADVVGEFKIDDTGKRSPASTPSVPAQTRTETRYTYEYDAQGNWTKKITSSHTGNSEFMTSAIVERSLTYYPKR